MQYFAEPGIIIDVLNYNMIFFNQQLIKYRNKVVSDDSHNAFIYYDRFRAGKRRVDPLPQWEPFFRYRSTNYDFYPFFRYFWNSFDPMQSAEEFFRTLNSESFRTCCFEHSFGNYTKKASLDGLLHGNISDTMQVAALLAKDGEDVEQFIPYLCSFSEILAEFITYLITLSKKMRDFHKQNVPKVIGSIESVFTDSDHSIRLMHNISQKVLMNEQSFTICMMEHFILMCKKFNNNNLFFFSGASGNDIIKQWSDTLEISLYTFGSELGNEVKYEIVQSLRKGERTVSQLSKQLYVSRSTIERHVTSLQKASIINVAKRIGVEIYYTLNPLYFIAAKSKLLVDFDDILEDIVKGSSSV